MFVQTRNCDLEYADDIVLLSKDPNKLQVFLGGINDSVGMFEIRFVPSTYEILFQAQIDIFLYGEELGEVCRFNYFSSLISPGGRIYIGKKCLRAPI